MSSTQFSTVTTSSRINENVSNLPPSGIRAFFDLVASTPGVVSLGVGEPDFATPWHISEAGIHSLETGQTSYTSNSGTLELREAISDYIYEHYQATYNSSKEILITVGGSEGLDLAFRALLEPNDQVIVVDPSFVSYAPLVTLAGGTPVRVPTYAENGFRPLIEDLERAVNSSTKALIVNYPNNPTGMTLTLNDVKTIANFALKHHLFLISDELYVPLSYEGNHPSFVQIPELRDHLIVIHGFSKAWAMTGWRLGMALGPQDVIAAMTKIHQYSVMCAPTTAQFAALEAIKHGQEAVESMKKEYDSRRRYFTHHLNRIGLTCTIPQGAFYAFPSIQSTGLTSMSFAEQLLKEKNVAVVPGTAFGECGEGYIRCSYASSLEDLREALNRIESFCSQITKS